MATDVPNSVIGALEVCGFPVESGAACSKAEDQLPSREGN